ncbi:MAG: hypothetical protein AAF628_01575 [Planctomycetota bacterium]
MKPAVFIATAFTISASALAQPIIIVDQSGGPGAQFTDLPPAVAAAPPRAILQVRAGQYSAFTTNKPLRVLGEPGVQIVGVPVVRRLPKGEQFVLRGMHASPTLWRNQGHIHLEDVSFGLVDIDACAHVSVTAGGQGIIRATDSSVVLSNVTGCGQPGCLLVLVPLFGGEALRITRSQVVAAGGSYTGGNGTYSGGEAILLNSGRLTITDQTRVQAGQGGPPSYGIPAIVANNGELIVDPGAVLAPTESSPPVIGGASLTSAAVAYLEMDASAAQLASTLHAPAGQQGFVLASAPTPPIPLPIMDLWVDPLHVVIAGGTVPASGMLTGSVSVPPVAPGTVVATQAVVLGSAPSLSNPVVTRVE